jgi:predicted small integral membrane protein
MIFTILEAANWGDVGKEEEKGLFDFDFITWMAWTWPTASFFIFIALCITVMFIWEKKVPGGSPRKGILGLNTTRGDRLFVSLLGSAFIHLAWLGLVGSVLWIASIICVAYFIVVFKYV